MTIARAHEPHVYADTAREYPLWSNVEIAAHLGVDESTVRRNLKRESIPQFLTPVLDKPIETIGKLGIAADWHVPLCDYAYAEKMVDHFVDLGITTLSIPGDYFNLDALSQYEPKQTNASLEREVYEGTKLMDVLLSTFDRVVYSKGNHDFRIAKKLGYYVPFKQAVGLLFSGLDPVRLARLEISNLDFIWNRPYEGASDYESWYICHPSNYSSLPLSVAREMSGKMGSHVLTAHSHHCAMGYAKNGHHVVGELGGLHDRSVTAYLQESNKFSRWQQGYAWINEQNKLRMASPGWTND